MGIVVAVALAILAGAQSKPGPSTFLTEGEKAMAMQTVARAAKALNVPIDRSRLSVYLERAGNTVYVTDGKASFHVERDGTLRVFTWLDHVAARKKQNGQGRPVDQNIVVREAIALAGQIWGVKNLELQSVTRVPANANTTDIRLKSRTVDGKYRVYLLGFANESGRVLSVGRAPTLRSVELDKAAKTAPRSGG